MMSGKKFHSQFQIYNKDKYIKIMKEVKGDIQ